MKAFLMVLASLLIASSLPAQETLISGDVEFGGYGGPFIQFTRVNGEFGLLVGGGGGLIIDHTVSLGGAGYGLTNDVSEESAPAGRPYINLAYGGGFIQYIHRSDDLMHLTGALLIGGGGVGYRAAYGGYVEGRTYSADEMNDAFFILEPSVDGVLNVAKNVRISVGVGYRYVSGIEVPGLSNSDIAGPSARLMFSFGSF